MVEFADDGMGAFVNDEAIGPATDPPPGYPMPMGMTIGQFIESYNAACADGVRVQEPTDRDGTVFGITYLAAGDRFGLYMQLAIDVSSGQVLVAGAKLDASEDGPDMAGLGGVAAAVMCVVFSDLSDERREALLGQVLDEGEQPGAGGATRYEGGCVVNYVVYDDGERTMLMYRAGA